MGVSRPAALLAVLLVLLLPGCTTKAGLRVAKPSDLPSSQAPSPHSETDATYANELGDLHEQAVTMANMASSRPVPAAVRDLAGRVSRTRLPAMVALDALRRSWGVERRRSEGGGTSAEVTDRQMSRLGTLEGSEFEDLWLRWMTANYRSAIALSRSEVDQGRSLQGRKYAAWVLDELEPDLQALDALARP